MDKKPPIDHALVKAFVANAHGNLEKVKALLAQQPGLLHAAWDWGGGDWETALGAAAHTGKSDIARFLIERGARLDVFAAAMLGDTSTVRALLDAQPTLRGARGPHGIGLLAHAEVGGEDAKPVIALLQPPPANGSTPTLPFPRTMTPVRFLYFDLGSTLIDELPAMQVRAQLTCERLEAVMNFGKRALKVERA